LSIRTQFSSQKEEHLTGDETMNPPRHRHFWEPSRSMEVILLKNDRSFLRYALGRECTFAAFPVISRHHTSRSFSGASDVETLSIVSSSFDLNTSGLSERWLYLPS